jgi:hypothetical protein
LPEVQTVPFPIVNDAFHLKTAVGLHGSGLRKRAVYLLERAILGNFEQALAFSHHSHQVVVDSPEGFNTEPGLALE